MVLTLTASIMYWSLQKKPGQLAVLEETDPAEASEPQEEDQPEEE